MKIKFVDLQRQNKQLEHELASVFKEVVLSADFSLGSRLEDFEQKFAAFCHRKYAIGVNSGTDAVLLSLMAYGITSGDEVITVPNSYFSTAAVITRVGARPVFVDIDPDFYTMDVCLIEKKITKKTKAIIPVHLFGQAANMDPIIKIAAKRGLVVLEDCCQAHGATYNGRVVPISETGAFSFYPGKNLGAFGDGGAVVTDNKKVAEKIKNLRNDGSYKKYIHSTFGIKSRLDTLQAAILNVKLPYLRKWNNVRSRHAKKYSKLLENIPGIRIPKTADYAEHVFHLYVIECKMRDALAKFLTKRGIETVIHYPIPIHLQEAYRGFGFKKGDFPITERVASRILSLPMFPELKDEEIAYITDSIKEFAKKDLRALIK